MMGVSAGVWAVESCRCYITDQCREYNVKNVRGHMARSEPSIYLVEYVNDQNTNP